MAWAFVPGSSSLICRTETGMLCRDFRLPRPLKLTAALAPWSGLCAGAKTAGEEGWRLVRCRAGPGSRRERIGTKMEGLRAALIDETCRPRTSGGRRLNVEAAGSSAESGGPLLFFSGAAKLLLFKLCLRDHELVSPCSPPAPYVMVGASAVMPLGNENVPRQLFLTVRDRSSLCPGPAGGSKSRSGFAEGPVRRCSVSSALPCGTEAVSG